MSEPNTQITSGEGGGQPFTIFDLIESGGDGGDLMGFYCKGHVARHEFAIACNKQTGADCRYDVRFVRADECHHVWWRTVPISGEPGHTQFCAAEPGARGAWKATVWEGVSRARMYGMRDYVASDRAGHRRGFGEGVSWALRTLDGRFGDAGEWLLKVWRGSGEQAEEQYQNRGTMR